MTVVYKLPFQKTESEAVWPHFFSNVHEKHGFSGSVGSDAETAAIKNLTTKYNPTFTVDCSESPLMQMMGIDLILKMDTHFMTIDVKGGRSGLYYDTRNQEWFITFTDEYFFTMKENRFFMHQSIKGDFFCIYDKHIMYNWLEGKRHLTGLLNPRSLENTTQYKLYRRHWPDFLEHNL